MKPSELYSYIQFMGSVPNDVAPFTAANILILTNIAKNNISQAIVQFNPDYFETIAKADTVSSQQDYQKPTDLLLFKRLDVAYSDPTVVGAYNPARKVSLAELSDQGENYYASNQPTGTPLFRFAGTQFYLYPTPTSTTYGTSYLRTWYVPYPTDLANLTNSTDDIETLTGIGKVFHELIGDYVINHIKGKKGELSALDVQMNNQHILDTLVPGAFRQLSTVSSSLPSDVVLQTGG